jgi:hypothetical protein
MYINQIDELFDSILNKLNDYLQKEETFKKLKLDTNFVKYQNDILNYIKKFIDLIPKKDIINIIKNESYYEIVINIIKRYCAFYIYLGIGYYYEGSRDLYITNIIETSRYQKDAIFQIPNFFNSENNAKIITFYNDIKNFISLIELKTIDKIKIILSNNPQRYETTISLFNDLGEDFIVEYFLIKDNFHNILKAIIFKQIYIKEEKNEIINILNQQEKSSVEYKYIEIVISNEKKIVDFNVIQKFLNISELKSGLAEEIYNYLEENRDKKEIIIKENQDYINYLFNNKIIIPITEDFLRFHKDIEKYDPESLVESSNIKEREATKIKYIISKMNNVINYNSPLLEKNPKLKLETEKLFFKPLQPKLAVLYNDNEEIKIIQKLELSENVSDYDMLIDLLNIRKYSYVNFKNFSKDGIKIRPQRTIEGIRKTSLIQKQNVQIETRIGHDNIDMNVIGIAWNPSKKPFECFNYNNLINVKHKSESNGYNEFIKTIEKTFDTKNDKLYYWLFDNKTDKSKSIKYNNYNVDNAQNNIKLMIEEIYYNYINLVTHKFKEYIKSIDNITIWDLYNIFKGYKQNYFNFDLTPNIKNELTEYVLLNKVKEIEIIPDEIDSIIPGKSDTLIELPVLKVIKVKKNIITIGEKVIDVKLELSNKSIPICHHYIKWRNINSMGKKTEDFNQAVFDFVKQYVKTDERGEYMCKSCNELVKIQKFEGTYDEELNSFLITSISITQQLEEIPKYSKYMRTIRNIGKNIEKLAYSMDILSFLGNMPAPKIKRKMIIKDVIDLVLIHTEWLKNQPKNRIEQYNQKYGIGKDLTNLFFFELKDEIFLTSSTDTDQYKIIKYNNIMAYLICIILTELNSGQILSLREDKKINYFFFQKIGNTLFSNLFLRLDQKVKIPIIKLPLLSYIIYYLSGMMVANRLWLYNDSAIDAKDKPIFLINIQKTVIHTVIDLLNTLIEANFEENKNFMYEIITTRINIKIKYIYNDEQLLKRVEAKALKDIKFDETTKKVTLLIKKVNFVGLNIDFNSLQNHNENCSLTIKELDKIIINTDNNLIDNLTNCSDGKFHKWSFKNNDLICELCNKSYHEILKTLNTTSSENNSNEYLDKLKNINMNKLAKKYCISGEVHEIDNTSHCIKCKININTFKPTNKDLKQLEKNLEIKSNEILLEQINIMKEYNKNQIKKNDKIKEIISNFNKEYEKIINLKLDNYVNTFIDKLIKILGNKIKVNDKIIYLKETTYIIDHDYLGNTIKSPINILSSDNKIQFAYKHTSFNKDVIYYKDKSNNVYVYYDSITMQYLGYSDDNKNIKKNKNNPSLQVELSIKDSIIYLGYENQYYNVFHVNKDFQDNLPDVLDKESIIKIIRTRINDLKQIIMRTQSMINNIRNSGKILSNYSIGEKEIVNEFTKKLKKFNISDNKNENQIFQNFNQILSNIHVNYKIPENFNINLNKNYIDVNIINSLNNSDIKLIYYLIDNFNKLLDYNTQPAIESELAHLLVKIIKFLFNLYYRPYFNYNIRKFDYLLLNETPYIDETLRLFGHYQELLTKEEIDDPDRKESEYSNKEANDALDIDDYGDDDEGKYEDIDNSAEALDGYE